MADVPPDSNLNDNLVFHCGYSTKRLHGEASPRDPTPLLGPTRYHLCRMPSIDKGYLFQKPVWNAASLLAVASAPSKYEK